MRSTVVIKGSRSGLSVYLDPEPPFSQLLRDIAVKFRESAKFWGSVQMALTLEGRELTAAEEFAVVNTITENSQIEILCLLFISSGVKKVHDHFTVLTVYQIADLTDPFIIDIFIQSMHIFC